MYDTLKLFIPAKNTKNYYVITMKYIHCVL